MMKEKTTMYTKTRTNKKNVTNGERHIARPTDRNSVAGKQEAMRQATMPDTETCKYHLLTSVRTQAGFPEADTRLEIGQLVPHLLVPQTLPSTHSIRTNNRIRIMIKKWQAGNLQGGNRLSRDIGQSIPFKAHVVRDPTKTNLQTSLCHRPQKTPNGT